MTVLRRWFGSKESASEKQLLHRWRGDRLRFERLIELELMHRPGLSRAAGARAALDRMESRDVVLPQVVRVQAVSVGEAVVAALQR